MDSKFAAMKEFGDHFTTLTGKPPLPWQRRLYEKHFAHNALPAAVNVPTGLGKTAVMALWLIALARQCADKQTSRLPLRLVYVVDRRAVVDQASDFAETLRENLTRTEASELREALGLRTENKLPISTLRGQFVDNREWLEDPSLPAIIIGTVDMIGSRLLFEGYGVSRRMRPYHAGLLGADALVLLDEAHLVPPFEALLTCIASQPGTYGPQADGASSVVPAFRVLPLSATSRTAGQNVFALQEDDYKDANDEGARLTRQRLGLNDDLTLRSDMKQLRVIQLGVANQGDLVKTLGEKAWDLSNGGSLSVRILVYCDRREDAQRVHDELLTRIVDSLRHGVSKTEGEKAKEHEVRVNEIARDRIELFVGARRVQEREEARQRLETLGFLADSQAVSDGPRFLVATSAGEVGVDLDADHMVCDLVPWDRMVQRFGRVNRRGGSNAQVCLVVEPPPKPNKREKAALDKPQNERSDKDKKAIADYEKKCADRKAHLAPFEHESALPRNDDGSLTVSPAAFSKLMSRAATDDALRKVLSEAVSKQPLRPALTRPLVDAWSMTSLKEHTGRPRIEPWLRGWVEDEPQTSVVWRMYLPLRSGKPATKREIEDFFDAAPPDTRERLETETRRVWDWLSTRIEKIALKGKLSEQSPSVENTSHDVGNAASENERDDADSAQQDAFFLEPLDTEAVVALVLSAGGDYVRSLQAGEILFASQKSEDNARKKEAERARKEIIESLYGATLIVSARIGGLRHGLLDAHCDEPVHVADGPEPWGQDEKGNPFIRFRMRVVEDAQVGVTLKEGDKDNKDDKWQEALRFDLERDADGGPTKQLLIEEWPDAENTEDRRSNGPRQTLAEHQSWTECAARKIAARLKLQSHYSDALAIAARLHDEGKRADRWQRAFRAPRNGGPYAKVNKGINQALLDGYRHEFGSLPYAAKDSDFQKLPEDLQDLVLHLIAAHHGQARPVIERRGCEDAPPSALEERAREVALRFARLQHRWGPWGLAWWEALLRAADQQASRENERKMPSSDKGGN